MKSKKSEVRLLYDLLQHKDRWYIRVTYPVNDTFEAIAERAKDYANDILMEMSFKAFYERFKIWDADESKIIKPDGDYYYEYLHELVWELGLEITIGMERDWYAESIDLQVIFI